MSVEEPSLLINGGGKTQLNARGAASQLNPEL